MTPNLTLADAIAALVAEKRAVGYKYAAEARVLTRFERFCRGASFPDWARSPRSRSRHGSPPLGDGASDRPPCRAWPRR